ncbi:MAG: phytanoyl-CoA dioxygenase [Rhodospirillales bacterium]|nr:MAG: phytanoyl-CoA dioxygenase [Rhodospirillales bacterium]
MASTGGGRARGLSDAQVRAFVRDGYARIDGAFSRTLADQMLRILWRATGCDPRDRATWTRPLIRLGAYGQRPFQRAANTAVLRAAYDQLVGAGRWRPRRDLGGIPVRFPSAASPGDEGWHLDVSFPGVGADPEERHDFSDWRVNVTSRGRALLMLFLFSDVGVDDAPTRIRVGSHMDAARRLKAAGDAGLPATAFGDTGAGLPEALATGAAGTVYLCHPFIVHAAQRHRGSTPRFMAQAALGPAEPLRLRRDDGAYSPVEIAIRRALSRRRRRTPASGRAA